MHVFIESYTLLTDIICIIYKEISHGGYREIITLLFIMQIM